MQTLSDKGRIKDLRRCHSDQLRNRTLTRRLFRCLRSSHGWSRRQFLTGVGVLAAVSGTAGRVVAKTLNINGVRYGMVHDESLS